MAYAVDAYDLEISENDLKHMKYYRERLNARPLTTALRSFDINENYESTRLPGVYEISQDSKVIYIGGNPCLSNIRDCLNAHFSGNDGLPIGGYLSGPAKNKWKSIFIRWLTCAKPNEVAWFLLSDFQMQHGCYPPFNYPAENCSSCEKNDRWRLVSPILMCINKIFEVSWLFQSQNVYQTLHWTLH